MQKFIRKVLFNPKSHIMKANPTSAYISSGLSQTALLPASIKDSSSASDERYVLSFFEIFKTRITGEKIFSYLQRLGLVRKNEDGNFIFIPKTRSGMLPIVCLYRTLDKKGYLKRMTQTEAGYYFCKAFGKSLSNIRMFYIDQLDACKKYDDYFFHIPEYEAFIR